MKIMKVKIRDSVVISYQKNSDYSDITTFNSYELISKEKPKKEFVQALNKLNKYIPMIMDLNPDINFAIDITGIKFKYKNKDEDIGFVISGKRIVSSSNTPLNINTPLIFRDSEHDLPISLFDDIDIIIKHAIGYIQGEREPRSQTDMGFNETGD